jgi:hypothetical protein
MAIIVMSKNHGVRKINDGQGRKRKMNDGQIEDE